MLDDLKEEEPLGAWGGLGRMILDQWRNDHPLQSLLCAADNAYSEAVAAYRSRS